MKFKEEKVCQSLATMMRIVRILNEEGETRGSMILDAKCNNTQGTVFTVLAFKLEEEAQGTAQKTRSKYDVYSAWSLK